MKLYDGVMSDRPSETTVAAWVRLNRARHAALTSIEAALKQAGLPPLVWYDVLLELSRAEAGGLRPYEIERRMLLPQYGLSRLLDRIEAAGYIRREPCPEDGRGFVVHITATGAAVQRRMGPHYADAIQHSIAHRLAPEETTRLAALLHKLVPE